jgi:acetate kinase
LKDPRSETRNPRSALRILVFNAGSSSLKYRLVDEAPDAEDGLHAVASGVVEKIGEASGLPDHSRAAAEVFSRLSSDAFASRFDALGHRVVHGGERFADPVRLDDRTITALENLGEIAPLHNARALAVVRACRDARPELPQVAVFDTAFHRGMPEKASLYAISRDLALRHGVRRFGFHGTAFRSLIAKYARSTGRGVEDLRLVAFQLGNGASACAIDRGRSVDTSMGFTPLEGLVMGTRSGDLDPALVVYLARRENVSAGEVVRWLNERSGLAGLSGVSRDAREIERAADSGNARARLALDLFAYRARKYLGAYLAVLGHADAVLFGGGIGEHMPRVRAAILEGLEELELKLDPSRNERQREGDGRISAEDSRIDAWALATDEESVIARDAIALLRRA